MENMDIFKLFQFLDQYKFKFFKPWDIHMTIWEHFIWWQKDLEEINQMMHLVSNDAITKSESSK